MRRSLQQHSLRRCCGRPFGAAEHHLSPPIGRSVFARGGRLVRKRFFSLLPRTLLNSNGVVAFCSDLLLLSLVNVGRAGGGACRFAVYGLPVRSCCAAQPAPPVVSSSLYSRVFFALLAWSTETAPGCEMCRMNFLFIPSPTRSSRVLRRRLLPKRGSLVSSQCARLRPDSLPLAPSRSGRAFCGCCL